MADLDARIREDLERVYWNESEAVSAADERADALRAVLDRCRDGDVGLNGYVSTHAIRTYVARALGVLDG